MTTPNRPYPGCPLVVAYGLGVNSTAMLVEFASRPVGLVGCGKQNAAANAMWPLSFSGEFG
jgi:hypothetical protein